MCRGPGRAGAGGSAGGGVRNGRGSGACGPAPGNSPLPKAGNSACLAVTALLKLIAQDPAPSPGGGLQIPRPISGSEMAKDEEAEVLLPGETENQADTSGKTLLMRITLSHECDCVHLIMAPVYCLKVSEL